jgi:hypothetical protein
MKLRLIGDVHGHVDRYLVLLEKSRTEEIDMTIQLGDMGFKDSYGKLERRMSKRGFDIEENMFIGGNHDDYDHRPEMMMNDFGTFKINDTVFFWIRGALSVDKAQRRQGISWWEEEELSYRQGFAAIEAYEKARPDIMLTHDCPVSLLMFFLTNAMKEIPSRTGQILQECLDVHRPKKWFFGHHHRNKTVTYRDVEFTCIDELSYQDLEL